MLACHMPTIEILIFPTLLHQVSILVIMKINKKLLSLQTYITKYITKYRYITKNNDMINKLSMAMLLRYGFLFSVSWLLLACKNFAMTPKNQSISITTSHWYNDYLGTQSKHHIRKFQKFQFVQNFDQWCNAR